MTELLTAPPSTALEHASFLFQAKSEAGGDLALIEGYGVTFGTLNDYGRVFVPGSLAQSIEEISDRKPLTMGYQHNPYTGEVKPIGKWSEISEEKEGLFLGGRISDTQLGRDVSVLARDGAITGLSIGFRIQEYHWAEPNDRVSFDTPFGRVTYQFDDYVMYIVRCKLRECSLVDAPADDEARLTSVQSSAGAAVKALPALQSDESSWDDVAYSMALLMGGRGAGAFSDLPEVERHALYQRVAQAYTKFGNTPPPFEAEPKYRDVAFQHGEREIFQDRYLRKTCSTVIAGAGGLEGALSPETRETALQAIGALQAAVDRRAPEDETEPAGEPLLAEMQASLRQTLETVKKGTPENV